MIPFREFVIALITRYKLYQGVKRFSCRELLCPAISVLRRSEDHFTNCVQRSALPYSGSPCRSCFFIYIRLNSIQWLLRLLPEAYVQRPSGVGWIVLWWKNVLLPFGCIYYNAIHPYCQDYFQDLSIFSFYAPKSNVLSDILSISTAFPTIRKDRRCKKRPPPHSGGLLWIGIHTGSLRPFGLCSVAFVQLPYSGLYSSKS